MELNMKVTGDLIKHAVMENSGMLMEMCLKENGLTIKPTVMVFMFIRMEQDTKENGKTIYSMAKVKRSGQITLCMKDIIMKVRNMEKDYIFGKMVQAMMEIGMKTV
jgi:hypothetical protein